MAISTTSALILLVAACSASESEEARPTAAATGSPGQGPVGFAAAALRLGVAETALRTALPPPSG